MSPNRGSCPPEAEGKRVRVRLRHAVDAGLPDTRDWPADGRGGCRWSLTGDPFDIAEYEVIA